MLRFKNIVSPFVLIIALVCIVTVWLSPKTFHRKEHLVCTHYMPRGCGIGCGGGHGVAEQYTESHWEKDE
jgi:hypothetical protein